MAAAVVPVSLLNPTAEEAESRKAQAKRHFEIIRRAGGLVSVNSLRIGYHAYALKRDNLFGILGFETERDAQEASGVKDSTWYNVIRIAEAYPGVSEDLFCGMKLSNAQALMDLPESKRLTEYWVRKAGTEPMETFRIQIEEELHGAAKPSDGREKSTSYKITLPTSRKNVVVMKLREYGKQIGEEDESRALEMMVVEHSESISLIGTISAAAQKIAELKELGHGDLSAGEALEKVYEGLDEIIAQFTAALESVQSLDSDEE